MAEKAEPSQLRTIEGGVQFAWKQTYTHPLKERTEMRQVLWILVGSLLLTTTHAASFDCARAATQAEKLICADPTLVSLDSDLNSAYAKLMGNLDATYRARLREAQSDWITLRNRMTEGAVAEGRKPPLAEILQQRIKELRGADIRINNLRLLRLGGRYRPIYVLAELPGTATYNHWADEEWEKVTGDHNDRTIRSVEPACREGCNAKISVQRIFYLDFASPELLSVHEGIVSYSEGAAHPSNEDVHLNWWLSKPGKIAPAEMFIGTSYRKVIEKYVAKFHTEIEPDDLSADQKKAGFAEASKPENWGIRANALHVTGQGYDFSLGRGFVEIDIPWDAFGAGLNPDFKARLQRHNGAPVLEE